MYHLFNYLSMYIHKVRVNKRQRLVSQESDTDEEEGPQRRQAAPVRPWTPTDGWMVGTKVSAYIKPILDTEPIEVEWDPVKKSKKRANCRQCYQSKPGATPGAKPIPGVSSKAGYKCSKCNVALHINCFKE